MESKVGCHGRSPRTNAFWDRYLEMIVRNYMPLDEFLMKLLHGMKLTEAWGTGPAVASLAQTFSRVQFRCNITSSAAYDGVTDDWKCPEKCSPKPSQTSGCQNVNESSAPNWLEVVKMYKGQEKNTRWHCRNIRRWRGVLFRQTVSYAESCSYNIHKLFIPTANILC